MPFQTSPWSHHYCGIGDDKVFHTDKNYKQPLNYAV